jgi:hypothetical protein
MDNIQDQYRRRKMISSLLLGAVLATIIVIRFVLPEGEYSVGLLGLIALAAISAIAGSMYYILRCPRCNASLLRAESSLWTTVKSCPKCGVRLVED